MASFYNTFVRHQNLGIAGSVFGVLGLLFFWWAPTGMILGLVGLLLGLIGLVQVRRESGNHAWIAAAIVVSLVAVAVGIVVAAYGWAPWQLTSYQ
jgi:uncharacterized membrane protein